ncbi:hypothetical protein UFOVP981_17 [uncultured Caudovirales phage]|jgi:hypothetical protein|uniref:Tail completion protein n=1 Tax=uncultured Caudovirales phage TaxID=2100421 RepID=A0A6J5Q334_9CAUD|nr:hypothetical protein UFOVP981_17 [uncultured Caudovirales phage]CAB4222439.1 hypothetical protein UFOVP1652_3 [uncultured Caudovirales phage]
MTASTILSAVRTPLATALAGVSANVFSYVPENVPVPAVVLVPDSPYMEFDTIGKSTFRAKLNFTISCCVAYNSNPASLDNIEQLITSVVAAIPSGYEVREVQRPTVTQVGASNLLVADIGVSTYYTQTN